MQVLILKGFMPKDGEMETTKGGMSIFKFSVGVNDRRAGKDEDGNWKHTEWFNCKCFNKQAEFMAKHSQKGTDVFVQARLETRSYEKDGTTRYFTEALVSSVEILGGWRDNED